MAEPRSFLDGDIDHFVHPDGGIETGGSLAVEMHASVIEEQPAGPALIYP